MPHRNSYCVRHNVSNSFLPLTFFGRESILSFGIEHAQWDTTISGVYHSVWVNPSNTFRKLRKAGKRFALLRSFIRSPKKHFYRLENHSKLTFFVSVTSFSDNHGQTSWDTFASLGRFPIYTGPTPPLIPQTKLDACIQNFFRVSTLHRVGGGRTARNFEKDALFYEGIQKWQKIWILHYCPKDFCPWLEMHSVPTVLNEN